jgi:hypothetical protein
VATQALLTVGDSIGGYRMVGIPDGLGAFDNGDGTFTLLMNHELGNTAGITRAHGSVGAFVSEWVVDKTTLQVQRPRPDAADLSLELGHAAVEHQPEHLCLQPLLLR